MPTENFELEPREKNSAGAKAYKLWG